MQNFPFPFIPAHYFSASLSEGARNPLGEGQCRGRSKHWTGNLDSPWVSPLGDSLKISDPQFSYVWHGDNYAAYLPTFTDFVRLYQGHCWTILCKRLHVTVLRQSCSHFLETYRSCQHLIPGENWWLVGHDSKISLPVTCLKHFLFRIWERFLIGGEAILLGGVDSRHHL